MTREAKNEVEDASATALDWASGLSPRHRAFVAHYITNGFNATKAYISAGYAETGAAQNACRLIRNDKVAAALKLALADALMGADELRARISDDAKASMDAFLSVDAEGALSLDWPRAAASGALRYIKRLKLKPTDSGQEVSFELIDRQRAQDQLARCLGLYSDRVELSGPGGAPIETRRALPVRRLSDAALLEIEAALEAEEREQAHEVEDIGTMRRRLDLLKGMRR